MHAGDRDMLAHCVAIVHARDEANAIALMRLAEKLRFGAIVAASPKLGHERFDHRLVFCLVHFDIDAEARKKLVFDLRHAASVSLAYAPIVLFLRDATPEEITDNIELGFDDVISVPEDSIVVGGRLATQIGQHHLYVETRHYLGPDRHRLDKPGVGARRKPEEEHAQLTILRTPEGGVQIIRRQVVAKGR